MNDHSIFNYNMIDRREIIINKTFNLLLIKGFDAVSISDIQSETGLSRGLLYHYFKNKEDLFIQVTEKYFIEIFDFDIVSTNKFSVYDLVKFMSKRFKRINKVVSDIISENNAVSKGSMLNYHFLFYQIMQRDALFRNKYRITTEKEQTAWEWAIRNSISQNQVRQDIDATLAARQLFALTDGIWFQNIFSLEGYKMEDNLEKELLYYIRLLQ